MTRVPFVSLLELLFPYYSAVAGYMLPYFVFETVTMNCVIENVKS